MLANTLKPSVQGNGGSYQFNTQSRISWLKAICWWKLPF